MRMPSFVALLLVGTGCIRATPPEPAVTPPPSAQAGSDSQVPKGWLLTGEAPQDFIARVDRSVHHGGSASGHLRASVVAPSGFGTLMQMVRADEFRGRRIRLSAYLRTRDANPAQLWMRVDGPNAILDFDNMGDRQLVGTTGWDPYVIVLDVPPESIDIAFGVVLVGGEVWIDDVVLEIVGTETPRTVPRPPAVALSPAEAQSSRARVSKMPISPRNLSFEEP